MFICACIVVGMFLFNAGYFDSIGPRAFVTHDKMLEDLDTPPAA